MLKTKSAVRELILFCLLVVVGVCLRLCLQHYPNVSPVAALALLAGCVFQRRLLAIAVPLSIMIISDLKFGGYNLLIMLSVYGCLAAPALAGPILRKHLQPERRVWSVMITAGASGLFCSLMFFLITNFAVWMSTSVYPRDLFGMVQCYTQAIPFFRHTLIGDCSFAILFLGSYAWVLQLVTRHSSAVVVN